jgi:hypothetical protein
LLKLKVNHNLRQATGQGQAIGCIGRKVEIDLIKISTNHTVDAGEASAAVFCDPNQQEALLVTYQRHRRSSSDPGSDFSLATAEQPRFVISSPRSGGLKPLVPSHSSSTSGDCIGPVKTVISAQLITRDISMATKDTMITEFRLAKVKAETLLELIEIGTTMRRGSSRWPWTT